MSSDTIDNLHKNYREALAKYSGARNNIESLGRVFSELGNGLTQPASRVRTWNIFCAGVDNKIPTDERSLTARKSYQEQLDFEIVANALSEWRSHQTALKSLHKELREAGEAQNAAPLPPDIRNTP